MTAPPMELVIPVFLGIGTLLGLLGGGGSILAVPVLVYLVKLEPKVAIVTSLALVGTSSLIAVLTQVRSGAVCFRTGALFGIAGMAGAYLGGRVAAKIPDGVLLLLFAALMLGTALAMLRGRKEEEFFKGREGVLLCPKDLPVLAILFDGLLVGSLTGLVGAGGGFLVVPALTLLGRLPMHAAIATSLLVITLQSAAALIGHLAHVVPDWGLTGVVTASTVVGSLCGSRLSSKVPSNVLKRGFGVFVLAVAGYVLHRELTQELIQQTVALFERHREFLAGAGSVIAAMLIHWLRHLLREIGRHRLADSDH